MIHALIEWLDGICLRYLGRRSLRSDKQQKAMVMQLDLLAASYLPLEEISADDRRIIEQVKPFTLVNAAGIYALLQAVEFVVQRGIEGDFVECGTYRGGCAMAMALKLLSLDCTDRRIILYDTFEGAPEPRSSKDWLPFLNKSAQQLWTEAKSDPRLSKAWFRDVYEEARTNVCGTGYPAERIELVRGLVEETIPAHIPEKLAILRLDTDWYESTLHELEHLYPRLMRGGVLIVDDYGSLMGARDATDEYFGREGNGPILLQRINMTVRQALKL